MSDFWVGRSLRKIGHPFWTFQREKNSAHSAKFDTRGLLWLSPVTRPASDFFFNRCAVSLHLGDTLVLRATKKRYSKTSRSVDLADIQFFIGVKICRDTLIFSKNPHVLIFFWKSAKTFVKSTQFFLFFPTTCNSVLRYTFFRDQKTPTSRPYRKESK